MSIQEEHFHCHHSKKGEGFWGQFPVPPSGGNLETGWLPPCPSENLPWSTRITQSLKLRPNGSTRLSWASCSWGHPESPCKLDFRGRERDSQRRWEAYAEYHLFLTMHHGHIRTNPEFYHGKITLGSVLKREGRRSLGSVILFLSSLSQRHWTWLIPSGSQHFLGPVSPAFPLDHFWCLGTGSCIYLLLPPHRAGHSAFSQVILPCLQGSLDFASRKHLRLTSIKVHHSYGTCDVNGEHRICTVV